MDLDVRELRKYTQYYGGFHDRHRVVVWFWDVLDKDFNQEEKKMFLKVRTFCSFGGASRGICTIENPLYAFD